MNETQIRRTFELMKPDNGLIEVRIIGQKTYSGYFRDVDNLIRCLKPFENEAIYFVFNKISDACYDRDQHEQIQQAGSRTKTTSDNDIEHRDWLLIDIDSKRPSGVGATDEEKSYAKIVVNKVFAFLRDVGFNPPIATDSGNGMHLLYRIDCPNNADHTQLIKNVLTVLDMFFSSNEAQIDTSVFNASRVTKLYGTFARKGKNTQSRPHRESFIKSVPDVIKATPTILLQKVADMLPKPEAPSFSNSYGAERFDLDNFIARHGIAVKNVSSYSGGQKYILEHCLFDESHKGKDSAIFKLSSGAIGYKCFHSSCACHTWRDVRLKFEPTAYDKQNGLKNDFRATQKAEILPQVETTTKGLKFLRMTEITEKDRSQIISIASGFKELDKKIIGFNKGEVSLWSGKNGSGKSSVLNQLCLSSAQQGFRTILFSGELDGTRVKQWIQLQSAGRQFTRPTSYENFYYVPNYTGSKIDEWLKDYLFVYNNEYGNNLEQLIKDIEDQLKKTPTDVLILDNIMALDLLTLGGDKYQQQTKAIQAITSFAKKNNIHIHIVAHPRKAVGFLRKDDISGTADLTNAVDNVLIIHRVNNDFIRLSEDFFGKKACDYFGFDNVIEVCKNRDLGVMDLLVGLYFEKESKRFLNERTENIIYGWQDIEILQNKEEKHNNNLTERKALNKYADVPF